MSKIAFSACILYFIMVGAAFAHDEVEENRCEQFVESPVGKFVVWVLEIIATAIVFTVGMVYILIRRDIG